MNHNKIAIGIVLVIAIVGLFTGIQPEQNTGGNVGGAGLVQGQYIVNTPSLSSGAINSLLLDASGNLKVTQATLQAGENTTLDRMMVTGYNTCIATTTDSIVATGAGVLNNFWVADHGASSGVVFRNALSGAGTTTIIAEDSGYPATATGVGASRHPGAIFSTGLHVDIIGTATTTICYVQ